MATSVTSPPLRDYQADMVTAVRRAIAANHTKMYCSLPTGCGKTRIASELVYSASQGARKTLWLVHRRELVRQAYDAIRARGVEDVGILMAEERDLTAQVVVASIQSLRADRVKELGQVDRIVIDECHHVSPGSLYDKVIALLDHPQLVVVGITATPYRADRKSMQDILPYCAYDRDIPRMINEGWLCEIRHVNVPIEGLDLSDVKMVRSLGEVDLDVRAVAPKVEEDLVVRDTVASTVDRLGDRPTIVFAASVMHAHLLAGVYRECGIKAAAIDGEMKTEKRDQIISDWRSGKIQLVANCAVLTEGFDYPAIGAVVVARPTLSVGLYLQMIGRGTRLASGKDDCIIFDVTGRLPPKAVAIELEDLLGEEMELEEDGVTKRVKKRDHQGGMQVHALRDPYGKTRFAWTLHPHVNGVWFTPISDSLIAALVPEPTSGLYESYVLKKQGWCKYEPHLACHEMSPVRQAIADLEATLAKAPATSKKLARRDEKWRHDEATDKQLGLLRSLDPALANEAAAEHWTKGDVSLAVDAAQIKQTVLDIQLSRVRSR